jgi:hypothetical protein
LKVDPAKVQVIYQGCNAVFKEAYSSVKKPELQDSTIFRGIYTKEQSKNEKVAVQ